MNRVTAAQVEAVRDELLRTLGPTFSWKADEATIASFARDESDLGEFPPQLVVFPTSTAEVCAVMRTCNAHRVPVTPVGARTGKSGGSLPLAGGVALCLSKMDRILEVSAGDLLAVVQPGVITGALMAAAEAQGLFYPPDPNSWETCTLGGNIAENAGGPRALKYGVTRDYVLGLEWVLPTGEVVRVGHRTSKGVAGYDLVGLFVGSEGTLGVATEITLKLVPKPRAVQTALVAFPSVRHAAEAVGRVLALGLVPRALELLDDVVLQAVAGKGVAFPEGSGAVLIIELDGHHAEALFGDLIEVSKACEAAGALDTQLAQDDSQREALWKVRRLVSPALRAITGTKLSEDIVVPRSRIPEAIERFKALGRQHGLIVATYGHAGDGNLHTNVLFHGPQDRPRVDALLEGLMRVTVELGGTITGEHGVGLAKKKYLHLEQSALAMDLQRRLRVFFDPQVVLNPGKIFPDAD